MKRMAGVLAVTALCLAGAACSGGSTTATSSAGPATTTSARSSSDTASRDRGAATDTAFATDDTSADTGFSGDTSADSADSGDPYLSDDSVVYDPSNHGAAADVALEHKLLTTADLPKGWFGAIVSGAAADNSSGNGPECLRKVDRVTADAKARGLYGSTAGATQLDEKIGTFAGRAPASFTQAVDRLKACTTFSYTTSKGAKITGRLLPARLPQVGDESQAFLGALSDGHVAFALELAYVRKGDMIMSISYVVQKKPDPAAFEALVQKAAAKF